MINTATHLSWKQIVKYAVIGILIVAVFLSALVGAYYYVGVMGNGGPDALIAAIPVGLFLYMLIISGYVSFFMAKLAEGKGKLSWPWAVLGFILTFGFAVSFPLVFSFLFPYDIPAIFSFFAPFLSTPITVLLMNIGRKPSASARKKRKSHSRQAVNISDQSEK